MIVGVLLGMKEGFVVVIILGTKLGDLDTMSNDKVGINVGFVGIAQAVKEMLELIR